MLFSFRQPETVFENGGAVKTLRKMIFKYKQKIFKIHYNNMSVLTKL